MWYRLLWISPEHLFLDIQVKNWAEVCDVSCDEYLFSSYDTEKNI